jgi:hypothetical protein
VTVEPEIDRPDDAVRELADKIKSHAVTFQRRGGCLFMQWDSPVKQAYEQAKAGNMPRGGIRSTSFRPGTSGNPNGRPRRPETIETRKIFIGARAAAREHTQDAIDTLAQIMKDQKAPGQARISAAQALLDRGHGRPLPTVETDPPAYDLDRLTLEELKTLRQILARATPPPLTLDGQSAN